MKIDIKTVDSDLLIQDGDFVFSDMVREQANTIIITSKGGLRNSPTLGVNINRFVGSSTSALMIENIIRTELIKDNIQLVDLKIDRTNDNIDIKISVKDATDI